MKPPRFNLWLFMLIVFFAILLVSPDSDAGGDRTTASSEAHAKAGATSNPVLTAGDNIGGDLNSNVDIAGDSSRAYALGVPGLGDVDIAGCLGSTQWTLLIGGKQKLETNWWCVTKLYLEAGLYDNASMAVCNTEVRQEFETEDECREAHPFKAMALSVPTESDDEDEEHDRIKAELADLTATVAALQRENAQLESQVQKTEKVAQRAYAAPQRAEYGLTDQQRAELAEVFTK